MTSISKWLVRIGFVVLLVMVADIRAQKDDVMYDEGVRLVQFADLEYPSIAQQVHIEGVVVVRARLDGHGNVVSAEAISGHKLLIPACVENSKKWRFDPSSPKTVIIVYEFRRDDRMCSPCRSLFLVQSPNFVSITTGSGILQTQTEK